jgi:negative regulator of sigma E activity
MRINTAVTDAIQHHARHLHAHTTGRDSVATAACVVAAAAAVVQGVTAAIHKGAELLAHLLSDHLRSLLDASFAASQPFLI